MTRAELEATADALTARLIATGVQPGQAVAVSLPNKSDAVAALFGVWRAGAVHVPLNPRLTPTEQARVLDAVRRAAVVGAGVHVDSQAGAAPHDLDVALIGTADSKAFGDCHPRSPTRRW